MGVLFESWERINQNRHVRKMTGTKITAFYTALSISYCILQLLFLISSWQATHRAGKMFETIVGMTDDGRGFGEFSYVDFINNEPHLRLCVDGISRSSNKTRCPVIWPVQQPLQQIAELRAELITQPSPLTAGTLGSGAVGKRSALIRLEEENGQSSVVVDAFDGLRQNGQPVSTAVRLDSTCTNALKWPYHHLLMVGREDIVALLYQVWLLFMSGFAVFNESIPHIGVSFMVHIIALVWSSIQFSSTMRFKADYVHLITDSATGACQGVDLIGDYFPVREAYHIAMVVINFVSLIASGYLTWRLVDSYGWSTFKKMGASISIARAYKAALALSIAVQLLIFFYMSSTALFLDEIRRGILGARPDFRALYLGGYTIATILTIPWLYLAWFGIRRESPRLMYAFYVMSLAYIGFSGGMFRSKTFFQTFRLWPFMGIVFSFTYVLLATTLGLAILCQFNFGKGLPHYFERRNGEDEYHDDFHPRPEESSENDKEKVSFPTDEEAVVAFPTSFNKQYSAGPLSRTYTQESYASVDSFGSSRLPPMRVGDVEAPRVTIPFPAIKKRDSLSRTLTPLSSSSSPSVVSPSKNPSAATGPSWFKGDDRHLMSSKSTVQRFDSTSSFGHFDSKKLQREDTFVTVKTVSSNVTAYGPDPSSAQTQRTLVGDYVTLPKRSLTASSTGSSASGHVDHGYPAKKRTVDLADEL